jgi:hypothetical protein
MPPGGTKISPARFQIDRNLRLLFALNLQETPYIGGERFRVNKVGSLRILEGKEPQG